MNIATYIIGFSSGQRRGPYIVFVQYLRWWFLLPSWFHSFLNGICICSSMRHCTPLIDQRRSREGTSWKYEPISSIWHILLDGCQLWETYKNGNYWKLIRLESRQILYRSEPGIVKHTATLGLLVLWVVHRVKTKVCSKWWCNVPVEYVPWTSHWKAH